MDKVRRRLRQLIEESDMDMKEVSMKIGRNHAYVQQFLERHIPARLKEPERQRLAELFNVDESELGGRTQPKVGIALASASQIRYVPEYDVSVSAGGGAVVDQEHFKQNWPFPVEFINDDLGLEGARIIILEVRGDSMEPRLRSGDQVMVNMSDCQISQPGIFVLHDGDGTVIKRVQRIPASSPIRLKLTSDNPLYDSYEIYADDVNVVGRVVWAGVRL